MASQRTLLNRVLKILLIFLFELIVPFGILIIPILLFPFLLHAFLKRQNPKYGPLLTGMSAMAAADKIYEEPLYAVLLFYLVDGRMDLEEHRKLFLENIADARDSRGKLIYPELRSHIARVLGYSMWKEDDNFHINNHIRMGDRTVFRLEPGQKIDEKSLARAANEILMQPFAKNRSPWEVMLYHDVKSLESDAKDQTLLIFRYHHALSDGYSITKLLSHITTGDYYASPPAKKKIPQWAKIAQFLAFPFVGIYVLCTYIVNYVDRNKWRFSTHKKRGMRYYCSESIAVSDVKVAKTNLKASFNAVMLCGIAGGIRKLFQFRGEPIPDQMHVGISFPVPGHPENKLTNHWTAVILNLHTEIAKTRLRVDAIGRQFKSFETKLVSQLPFVGSLWGGAFPADVIKLILKLILQGSTCSMSIFPGPSNISFLTGEKVLSGGFLLGPLETHGVAITVISYNGHLRIYFGLEQELEENSNDGELVTKFMVEEIKAIIRESQLPSSNQ